MYREENQETVGAVANKLRIYEGMTHSPMQAHISAVETLVQSLKMLPAEKVPGETRGRPLGFWSRGYRGSEANYTPTEKEILAAFEGVQAASEGPTANGKQLYGVPPDKLQKLLKEKAPTQELSARQEHINFLLQQEEQCQEGQENLEKPKQKYKTYNILPKYQHSLEEEITRLTVCLEEKDRRIRTLEETNLAQQNEVSELRSALHQIGQVLSDRKGEVQELKNQHELSEEKQQTALSFSIPLLPVQSLMEFVPVLGTEKCGDTEIQTLQEAVLEKEAAQATPQEKLLQVLEESPAGERSLRDSLHTLDAERSELCLRLHRSKKRAEPLATKCQVLDLHLELKESQEAVLEKEAAQATREQQLLQALEESPAALGTAEHRRDSLKAALRKETSAKKKVAGTVHKEVESLQRKLKSTEEQRQDVLHERDRLQAEKEQLECHIKLLEELVTASETQANLATERSHSLEQKLQTALSILKIKTEEVENQGKKIEMLQKEAEEGKVVQEKLTGITAILSEREREIKVYQDKMAMLEKQNEMYLTNLQKEEERAQQGQAEREAMQEEVERVAAALEQTRSRELECREKTQVLRAALTKSEMEKESLVKELAILQERVSERDTAEPCTQEESHAHCSQQLPELQEQAPTQELSARQDSNNFLLQQEEQCQEGQQNLEKLEEKDKTSSSPPKYLQSLEEEIRRLTVCLEEKDRRIRALEEKDLAQQNEVSELRSPLHQIEQVLSDRTGEVQELKHQQVLLEKQRDKGLVMKNLFHIWKGIRQGSQQVQEALVIKQQEMMQIQALQEAVLEKEAAQATREQQLLQALEESRAGEQSLRDSLHTLDAERSELCLRLHSSEAVLEKEAAQATREQQLLQALEESPAALGTAEHRRDSLKAALRKETTAKKKVAGIVHKEVESLQRKLKSTEEQRQDVLHERDRLQAEKQQLEYHIKHLEELVTASEIQANLATERSHSLEQKLQTALSILKIKTEEVENQGKKMEMLQKEAEEGKVVQEKLTGITAILSEREREIKVYQDKMAMLEKQNEMYLTNLQKEEERAQQGQAEREAMQEEVERVAAALEQTRSRELEWREKTQVLCAAITKSEMEKESLVKELAILQERVSERDTAEPCTQEESHAHCSQQLPELQEQVRSPDTRAFCQAGLKQFPAAAGRAVPGGAANLEKLEEKDKTSSSPPKYLQSLEEEIRRLTVCLEEKDRRIRALEEKDLAQQNEVSELRSALHQIEQVLSDRTGEVQELKHQQVLLEKQRDKGLVMKNLFHIWKGIRQGSQQVQEALVIKQQEMMQIQALQEAVLEKEAAQATREQQLLQALEESRAGEQSLRDSLHTLDAERSELCLRLHSSEAVLEKEAAQATREQQLLQALEESPAALGTAEHRRDSLKAALRKETSAKKKVAGTVHKEVESLQRKLKSTEEQRQDVLHERDRLQAEKEQLECHIKHLEELVTASETQANLATERSHSLEQKLQTALSILKIKTEEVENQGKKIEMLQKEAEEGKVVQEKLTGITAILSEREREIKVYQDKMAMLEKQNEMYLTNLQKEKERAQQGQAEREAMQEEVERVAAALEQTRSRELECREKTQVLRAALTKSEMEKESLVKELAILQERVSERDTAEPCTQEESHAHCSQQLPELQEQAPTQELSARQDSNNFLLQQEEQCQEGQQNLDKLGEKDKTSSSPPKYLQSLEEEIRRLTVCLEEKDRRIRALEEKDLAQQNEVSEFRSPLHQIEQVLSDRTGEVQELKHQQVLLEKQRDKGLVMKNLFHIWKGIRQGSQQVQEALVIKQQEMMQIQALQEAVLEKEAAQATREQQLLQALEESRAGEQSLRDSLHTLDAERSELCLRLHSSEAVLEKEAAQATREQQLLQALEESPAALGTAEHRRDSLKAALRKEASAKKKVAGTVHKEVESLQRKLKSTEEQRQDVLHERDRLQAEKEQLEYHIKLLEESVTASACWFKGKPAGEMNPAQERL
ncbi:centrosome-associated protein CEP250-like [Pithys albifrons albifrons]|uniref:centrosome-associated protein CEP250-like n=1 Tax=Pithys albifrons albifrons TaxID=3385563 RepID=UPI003A5CB558